MVADFFVVSDFFLVTGFFIVSFFFFIVADFFFYNSGRCCGGRAVISRVHVEMCVRLSAVEET